MAVQCLDRLIGVVRIGKEEDINAFLSSQGLEIRYNCYYTFLHYAVLWIFENKMEEIKWFDSLFSRMQGLDINGFDIIPFDSTDYDTFESTLDLACVSGSLCSVKWLVDHGAFLEGKGKFGSTPFLLSCLSRKDPLSKWKYLAQKGVNVKSIDEYGQSALHYASQNEFDSQEEALECFNYLLTVTGLTVNDVDDIGLQPLHCATRNSANVLLQLGADIEAKDIEGLTPFLRSVKFGTQEIMETLVERKCNVHTLSRENQNALHVTAKTFMYDDQKESIATRLLSLGINSDCFDNDGFLPYQRARGNLRAILKEALEKQRYSKLNELGTREADQCKICTIGPPFAGKTTLIHSLQGKRRKREKRADESQTVTSERLPERTAGVEITPANIDSAGKVIFNDFAGQPNFYGTHGRFFSALTTIFLLVLDLSLPRQLWSFACYWLSFVKCNVDLTRPAHVILIGSRGSKNDLEKLHNLRVRLARRYRDCFCIQEKVFPIDCRQCDVVEMQELKMCIAQVKAECTKERKVSVIIDDVQSNFLPRIQSVLSMDEEVDADILFYHLIRDSLSPFGSSGLELAKVERMRFQFQELIKEVETDIGLSISKLLDENRHFLPSRLFLVLMGVGLSAGHSDSFNSLLLQYLNDVGELICLEDVVIFDPGWLCNSVIGPVVSPESFPFHIDRVDDGVVTKDGLASAITAFNTCKNVSINAEEAIRALCQLKVCCQIEEKPSHFMVPALLQLDKRNKFWGENDDMAVYVGRRVQCSKEVDIISPGAFHFLQILAGLDASRQPVDFWNGGMVIKKLISMGEVPKISNEALVELQQDGRAIDIVVRGKKFSEKDCLDFLGELRQLVLQSLRDRSPGTVPEEVYLSTSQIKFLRRSPLAYGNSEIEEAKATGSCISTKDTFGVSATDSLRQLLAIPSDHVSLSPSVSFLYDVFSKLQGERGFWRTFALLLNIRPECVSEVLAAGSSHPATEILDLWTERLDSTLLKLKDALLKAEISDVFSELVKANVFVKDSSFEFIGSCMTAQTNPGNGNQNIPGDNILKKPKYVRHLSSNSKKFRTNVTEDERKYVSTFTERCPEVSELNALSRKIISSWKYIARNLGVCEEDIGRIEADNSGNIREQAFQMLSFWKQKSGSLASVACLCKALLSEELKEVAQTIFKLSDATIDCLSEDR